MIYLDHHATTPMDPAAVEAMLPLLTELYANAGSVTHAAGREVAELVDRSWSGLAASVNAEVDELVMTSGATESNNLALFGVCLHPRQKRRKVVSVVTEHKAILDPLKRLETLGFEIVLSPVHPQGSSRAGEVDLQHLAESIDERTVMVSVMLANNEIGVLQPLEEIARLCRSHDCLLHTDASQAVGRMEVDVDRLDVDLLSFSAHKFYGPKGIGGLFVRRRGRRVKLQSQIVGGGQQHNMRSGTLNSAGIVGMEAALRSTLVSLTSDTARIAALRQRLWERLSAGLPGLVLNGPDWWSPAAPRLSGNLNCNFYPVEGQSLMMAVPELAVSSGSACTSAESTPSHVLLALGLTEEQARSSLRFGIGRFNTEAEVDQSSEWLIQAAERLRRLL
jgi:cysteine desulfurase